MIRKPIILTLLALTVSCAVYAAPRTREMVLESASKMLLKAHPGMKRSPVSGERLEVLEANDVYTIVGTGGAYAIVANDDLMPEILAYSATPFDAESDNPGFKWWLRQISAAGRGVVKKGAMETTTRPDPSRFPTEVPHLLSDVWGQTEPFNNLCPLEYDAAGRLVGRTVVGCVATSSTQVMRYHQWPVQGEGIHVDMQTSDAHGNVTPIVVDFADYKFDYSKMRDSYIPGSYTAEEARAISEMSYAVGVSYGMIYGTGASGTYSDSAAVALRKYLKYPDATLMLRRDYDEKVWMETIFKEISENRPVLYSGADPFGTIGGGGHAFVFDGYDADGLVHVNWGWFGRNNGYYEVGMLNPRIHNFVEQQDMIIGLEPPGRGDNAGRTLTLTGVVTRSDLRDAVERSLAGEISVLDLTDAELEEGILPDMAFHSSGLRRIILPAGIRGFGDGVFGNCRNLHEVVFPAPSQTQDFIVEDNVVYSRDGKVVISVLPYYSNNLPVMTDYVSQLVFRQGVTEIRPYAADGCFRVQGVLIPGTVEKIGHHAFVNATALRVVAVAGSMPAAAPEAFAGIDAGYTRLHLPAGTSETYLRAGDWRRFFTFDNVYEYGTNVKARNVVRTEGEPNPEFTYQVFGDYVTGEPELTCEADAASPAGEYPIKVGIGSLSGTDIVLTDGILRVLPKVVGVETLTEDITLSGEVYTVDGRRVACNPGSSAGLEPGIYICGGKKIVVTGRDIK